MTSLFRRPVSSKSGIYKNYNQTTPFHLSLKMLAVRFFKRQSKEAQDFPPADDQITLRYELFSLFIIYFWNLFDEEFLFATGIQPVYKNDTGFWPPQSVCIGGFLFWICLINFFNLDYCPYWGTIPCKKKLTYLQSLRLKAIPLSKRMKERWKCDLSVNVFYVSVFVILKTAIMLLKTIGTKGMMKIMMTKNTIMMKLTRMTTTATTRAIMNMVT